MLLNFAVNFLWFFECELHPFGQTRRMCVQSLRVSQAPGHGQHGWRDATMSGYRDTGCVCGEG